MLGHTFSSFSSHIKSRATDTEATADRFLRNHAHLYTDYRYFRFNVPQGLQHVGLEIATKLPEITKATNAYIDSAQTHEEVRNCARSLQGIIKVQINPHPTDIWTKGPRLLSLDGGGVRGVSSLLIINKLMRNVNPNNPPKPCDYFDLIGGTGTGGYVYTLYSTFILVLNK